MLKNLASLECKIENREIKLFCDNDCPLPHLKEALFQFQKYLGQIEDQVKAAQEKAAAEKEEKECKEPQCPSSE
jgi:hypothetical protein